MIEEPTSQFELLVATEDDGPAGAEVIEAIALDLRTELADAGVLRVEQVSQGEGPDGTRALAEITAVLTLIVTAVQAGELLGRVVTAVRRVIERNSRRGQQPLRITIGGVDLDLSTADQATTDRIVQALLALPARSSVGVRKALVIANARYDDPGLAQLRSPSRDADELARVLGDPAIGGFDVELLTDADERTIRRRIAGFFAGRDRDDVLLLHFSCHGIKDSRGRLHLAARDTDLSVLGATSVPAAFVHDTLNETQSRRVVLILDCCYSGAFNRGATVRSGGEVHIADEFGAGTGRVVLTASSATEYAFEGGDLARSQAQPSVFTSALVDGLETGAADLDSDGEISIDELYDHTYRRVRDRTPNQAPMKWSFGVEGSLVVARSVRPAALPRSIVEDLASDRVVLRLEAVRALAGLLTSEKSGLRDSALAALARLRDTDDSVRVRQASGTALAGSGDQPTADTGLGSPATPELRPPRPAPPRADAGEPEDRGLQPRPGPVVRPATGTPATESLAKDRPATDGLASVAPATVTPRAVAPAFGSVTPGSGMTKVTGRLILIAALLVPISVLVDAVAVYGIAGVRFNRDWFHNLIWIVQVCGAGLLLATRHTRWAWFLIGVLAWAWIDFAITLQDKTEDRFDEGWGFVIAADLLAVAAQICLFVVIVRSHRSESGLDRLRVAIAVPLAAMTFATTFLLAPLIYRSWDLYLAGGELRTIAAIICAVAIPAAILAARVVPAAVLLPIGWLLGGAELALSAWINFARAGSLSGYRPELIMVWVLLILTTAAGIAAVLRLGGDADGDDSGKAPGLIRRTFTRRPPP